MIAIEKKDISNQQFELLCDNLYVLYTLTQSKTTDLKFLNSKIIFKELFYLNFFTNFFGETQASLHTV